MGPKLWHEKLLWREQRSQPNVIYVNLSANPASHMDLILQNKHFLWGIFFFFIFGNARDTVRRSKTSPDILQARTRWEIEARWDRWPSDYNARWWEGAELSKKGSLKMRCVCRCATVMGGGADGLEDCTSCMIFFSDISQQCIRCDTLKCGAWWKVSKTEKQIPRAKQTGKNFLETSQQTIQMFSDKRIQARIQIEKRRSTSNRHVYLPTYSINK